MKKIKEFWQKSFKNKVIVVIGVLFVLSMFGSSGDEEKEKAPKEKTTITKDVKVAENDGKEEKTENEKEEKEIETEEPTTVKQVKVPDLSRYSKKKAKKWCEKNGLTFESSDDYSEKVASGKMISQSIKSGKSIDVGSTIEVVYSLGKKPTREQLNALTKAETYSEMMYMSKKGIYEQLTSEYGEGFPADAAQYAIDHLDADYKYNALQKAKSYYEDMAMSKNAVYEQLVSEYGEQFTAEEAQYAIDHLDD